MRFRTSGLHSPLAPVTWLIVCCLTMTAVIARAELPLARLTSIAPAGGRQGTSVEVAITGQDLEGVDRCWFSSPGITAKPKSAAPADAGRFIVAIDAGVAPGLYDVRVIGRYGISNPRTFMVGTETEIAAKPGNVTPQTAIELVENSAVHAVAEPNAAQFYRLQLKRGQRVLIEAETARIDSKMEASLTLSDPSGREIAHSLRGEPIPCLAATHGDYLIRISDLLYRGGPEYFYRLAVTTRPWVDTVVPPFGSPDADIVHRLIGANLPADAAELASSDISAEADWSVFRWPAPASAVFLDGVSYRMTASNGLSNPKLLVRASAPAARDDESTHNTAELAQHLEIPCVFGGQFRGSRTQWFSFTLPAGQYAVEVVSQRLGEATGPLLLLQRLDKGPGGEIKAVDVQESFDPPAGGVPEFPTTSRDPACHVDVKEVGNYRVALRNLFAASADTRAPTFALVIRRENPDFKLAAVAASPLPDPKDSKDVPVGSTLLRRGGTAPIRVVIQRIDGFSGEVRLKAEGLPPGVTAAPATLPSGAAAGTLLLCAAPDAAGWAGPITIVGSARINGRNVERRAVPGTVALSTYDKQNKKVEVRSRVAAEYFVAVSGSEDCPLAITPAEERVWETCVAGKLSIPLKIVRRAEVVGPVSLKPAGHPLLAAAKEVAVDPKADACTFDLDLAQIKLTPGEYTLHAEVQAKVKYGKAAEPVNGGPPPKVQTADVVASFYSTPFTVRVLPGPVTFAPLTAATLAAGEKADLPVTLNRLFGFADPVGVKLILPGEVKNIRAAEIAFAKDQSLGKLVIEADANAATGTFAAKLQAKMKLNNQDLLVEQDVTFSVIAKPAK